jgi:EpsI family protein
VGRAQTKWIAAAIVAGAGISAHAIRATEPRDRGPLRLEQAFIAAADTTFVDEALESDFRATLQAREVLYRLYGPASAEPVWVLLAYFDQQREGSQVHSPRHCYPGAGWSIEDEIEMKASWRDGDVHALVVNNGVARRLVCYWYQMPGGITPDVLSLKLALTRSAVLRRPQDVVYGNISTVVDDGVDAAYRRIAPYVRDAETEIGRLYREQDERQSDTN